MNQMLKLILYLKMKTLLEKLIFTIDNTNIKIRSNAPIRMHMKITSKRFFILDLKRAQ